MERMPCTQQARTVAARPMQGLRRRLPFALDGGAHAHNSHGAYNPAAACTAQPQACRHTSRAKGSTHSAAGLTSKPPALEQVEEALALPLRDALAHRPEDQEQHYDGQHYEEEVVWGHGGTDAAGTRAGAATAAAWWWC